MIPGRTLTPASLAAMTKGEAVASEAEERRSGFVYGTRRPMAKMVTTKKKRILQNVFLIAAGTFLRGFSVSPAAIPTNSVPWYEKPAWMSTAQKPTNLASVSLFSMR